MSDAVTRVYWGCTTFHCDRGFHGTEEDMPREWTHCSACGGELTEITEYKRGQSEHTEYGRLSFELDDFRSERRRH